MRRPGPRWSSDADGTVSLGPPRGGGSGPGRVWSWLWVGIPQVVGTLFAASGQPERRALGAFGVGLLVAGVLALAGRGRFPVLTVAATVVTTGTYYAAGYPYGPAFFALLVAVIGAVRLGHRTATWALLAVGFGGLVLLERRISGDWLPADELFLYALWVVAGLGVAELVRSRAERMAEFRRGRAEAARRREEEDRRRASEERLLLARELHDVLAHTVSLINVQASTALHLIDEQPERARTALAAIKEASSQTLHELRATVNALRADGGLPRSPIADLARIDDLVAASAGAGLHVEVQRRGRPRTLPARVDLAAYRIVQEALTNVRRHSGATNATVVLSYDEAGLGVRVADDGRGATSAYDAAPGNGLRGMRERASALGGTFETSSDEHGFAVTARLPTEAP